MYGGSGLAYYNILSGILRGMGDSFSALIYLLVATVLNIVLDVWFVAGFKMGVAGVALATIVSQALSAAAGADFGKKLRIRILGSLSQQRRRHFLLVLGFSLGS